MAFKVHFPSGID